MEKLASSVRDACTNLGLSQPTIYRLISKGHLTKVKVGRRSLITMDSQRALLGLPAGTGSDVSRRVATQVPDVTLAKAGS